MSISHNTLASIFLHLCQRKCQCPTLEDFLERVFEHVASWPLYQNLSIISPSWHTTTTKSLQSCPTLCDPIDSSLPGSPIPGILQARALEWVAISFSNAWKWKVKVKSLSRVRLLATPWTAAFQAPLSMEFSRQEYWRIQPFSSPSDLPNPGIKLRSPTLQVDSLPAEPQAQQYSNG